MCVFIFILFYFICVDGKRIVHALANNQLKMLNKVIGLWIVTTLKSEGIRYNIFDISI